MSEKKEPDCCYFRVRHWVDNTFIEGNYGPFPPHANDEYAGKMLVALAARSDVLGIESVEHNCAEPLPEGRPLDGLGRAE